MGERAIQPHLSQPFDERDSKLICSCPTLPKVEYDEQPTILIVVLPPQPVP